MDNTDNSKSLIISLVCHGEELYRLDTADFFEEISIGRNEDCTWSVGHVDSSVSSRHAMISRRKKFFFITDLGSRNGIFLDGQKIKEKKLAADMTIQIGECQLCVSHPGKVKPVSNKPHFLKYQNENGRTIKVKLFPGTLKIGADARCDVNLNSALVSSPHLSITRKTDGSCWVKDLKSRNGTLVNKMELAPKTERMLKNGDVISAADIDIVYIDPSVSKGTLRLTLALAVLLVTAIIGCLLYYSYIFVAPSSEALINQARIAARGADFKQAEELLMQAATAKNSSKTVNSRRFMSERVADWQRTFIHSRQLQNALKHNRYKQVTQILGAMDLRQLSHWDWDENTAVAERDKALFVKETMDIINNFFILCSDPASDDEMLKATENKLQAQLKAFERYPLDYMKGLKGACNTQLWGVRTVRKRLAEYNKIIEYIRSAKELNYAGVIKKLETLQKGAPLVIKGKIEKVLPTLYAIQKAEKLLAERAAYISAMQFDKCSSKKLNLKNELAISNLDKAIAAINADYAKYYEIAQHLKSCCKMLDSEGLTPGSQSKVFTSFLDDKLMKSVWQYDSMQKSLPARRRTTPSGNFDRVMGVEYSYAVLAMLRTDNDIRSRFTIPFVPMLEQAGNQVIMVEHVLKYVDTNCPQLKANGKLGEYIKYLDSQLAIRDKILQKLAACKSNSERDRYLELACVRILKPQQYTQAQWMKFGKEFLQFRQQLQLLNSQYNAAMPEDAIKIREKILAAGLPGDPIVKRMWGLR